MLTIHLRINDEATGRPTPVRLRVTGPDEIHYAPLGRFTEFATGRNEAVGGHLQIGREKFTYIDGACEIRLPPGVPLRIQAFKGPEYEPLDREITLGAGQMALRFSIRRWSHLAAEGWHAGDTRVHSIAPHTALLEAAAEDVAVVNLLACQQFVPSLDGTAYPTISNLIAFSGQQPALESDGRMVVVNTLNEHPVLGGVGLLHSHRPVFPLTFGGEESDDWSITDWCRQCHRKNGLCIWVDAFRSELSVPGGEALAAAIHGQIDAIEIDAQPRARPLLPWWYHLLNVGLRLPLAGGSGKDDNRVPIGAMRTYARIEGNEPVTYRAWIEAVRAGKSFVTNGPMLRFTVDDRGAGETIAIHDTGVSVVIEVSVESAVPFERVEVVSNGKVVASTPASTGPLWRASIKSVVPVTSTCWFAARCVGAVGFAHISPVYVQVGNERCQINREATKALLACIEETRIWIESQGRFTLDKWKRQLLDECEQATARLSEPQDDPP